MPATATIIPERLAQIATITLEKGAHNSFDEGVCGVELAGWLVGEPWSDHPECVSPVVGAFIRAWNDGLPDAERTAIIRPLVPRLVGTRGSKALEERRALMAADWLVRVHTPAWLRLAKLATQAEALENLPEITAMSQVPSIRGPIEAARKDGAAAWDAAWDAAWAAARDADWDVAWAAAWAAARVAARAAARDALKPTVERLKLSARDLVVRMIEAKDAA